MDKRKILVTSALPYANGDIHLGHLVEYLQTDFWVRFQKFRGHDCVYFCADDTHGSPIMLAAKKLGITPESLIAEKGKDHYRDFQDFEINFTHYSSTHSSTNRELCETFFKKFDSYLETKTIEQAYCKKCEMFLPDRFVIGTCPECDAKKQYGDSCDSCGATYSPLEMKEKECTTCTSEPVAKSSEHLFFKLAELSDFLDSWCQSSVSTGVYQKLKEWFNRGLKAWNISRDKPYFGFEIPDYPNKYFYVWVDAPIGYIATTKEWCDENQKDYLKDYWQNENTEVYHFIGKDITYFHALFWPAMLKVNDYVLPKKLFVHGFLTINGEKMSKSKGTFVNARKYLDTMHPSYLRYYLASKMNDSLDDIDLNWKHFTHKVNAELIGKITNLVSRSAQMINKKLDDELGSLSEWGESKLKEMQNKSHQIAEDYENRFFSKIINQCREFAEDGNRYIDEKEPWSLIKQDTKKAQVVLTDVLNIFRLINIYLTPILPSYSQKACELFGEEEYKWEDIYKTIQNEKINSFEKLLNPLTEDDILNIL